MIEVKNLKKSFGPKVAVNGISFTVNKGEVLGFLGPNGAGKSTTMRMVTGYIPPTEGSVSVGGHDIIENPVEAKSLIGYLPENAPCYSDMTVRGFLSFSAEIRGLEGAAKEKAIDRVIEMCFLEAVVHQSIDTLSKGFRHRTCLAQSIVHDPPVLILDEPTDGLDPNQKHEIRTLIRRMGEEKAIIFSTHILEEVEAVCSRAMIIDRGRVVANGTPLELKRKARNAGTVVVTIGGVDTQVISGRLKMLADVSDVAIEEKNATSIRVRISPRNGVAFGNLASSVSGLARTESWDVVELHTDQGRLDDVFRDITMSETGVNGVK